jgi:hypothetical protein
VKDFFFSYIFISGFFYTSSTVEAKAKMDGYAKVTHLMTQHAEMAMFQRFDFLNTLNALYLQAELVHLQRKMKGYLISDFQTTASAGASCSRNDIGGGCELEGLQNGKDVNDTTSRTGNDAANTDTLQEIRVSVEERTMEVELSNLAGMVCSKGSKEEGLNNGIQGPESQLEIEASQKTGSTSSIGLPNPVKDWWAFANAEENTEAAEAWITMLETRAKLKEYSI